ncbi:MAG: hypothetical protein WC417_06170 [Candidatus Omnitrophota bacterium]|jgi:acetolactate synthase-1/2/3 large subunit
MGTLKKARKAVLCKVKELYRSAGVSFPDFIKIARAYGIRAEKINGHKGLAGRINRVLKCKGPVLCEVMLEPDYKFSPRLASKKLDDGRMISKPLEDMSPFLSRDEFSQNMLMPALPE